MTKLIPHTTIKVEAMVYMTELFPTDTLVGDANTGWKPLLSRKYDDFITSDEILIFINDVCDKYKSHKELKFTDFDHAAVAASLFTKYKCTVDEDNLGFILRTKTDMKYEEVEERRKIRWYERFLPYGFLLWIWNAFKNSYNGILESIRIG